MEDLRVLMDLSGLEAFNPSFTESTNWRISACEKRLQESYITYNLLDSVKISGVDFSTRNTVEDPFLQGLFLLQRFCPSEKAKKVTHGFQKKIWQKFRIFIIFIWVIFYKEKKYWLIFVWTSKLSMSLMSKILNI